MVQADWLTRQRQINDLPHCLAATHPFQVVCCRLQLQSVYSRSYLLVNIEKLATRVQSFRPFRPEQT